jgi:hypothetical protein
MNMSVNHTYILGGSLEINPNDPKFSKTEADALRGHLWQLRAAIPHFIKIKEEGPVGDYEYNLRNGDESSTVSRPCGHRYFFSHDTWVRPRCKDCEAWMENEVKTNGGIWSKRLLPGKRQEVPKPAPAPQNIETAAEDRAGVGAEEKAEARATVFDKLKKAVK